MSRRMLFALVLASLLLAACGTPASPSGSGAATPTGPRPAAQFLTPQATPGPVNLPADDGPHGDLTEWWYFTGHLQTEDGRSFGFEFVIFQGNRSGFPPIYAAHFAITDLASGTFHYDQRTQNGGQRESASAIDLRLGDWSLVGSGAHDHITASMPGYGLTVTVDGEKPPALHHGDGYFEWAPATGSYYYSRTRMAARGTLTADGAESPVSGQAWMDHQWGNFLLIGSGGWNWYSIQLDNGDDLMLWQSHDGRGQIIFGSGTFVDSAGTASELQPTDFVIGQQRRWASPRTGAVYPSGWSIGIPSRGLDLTVEPVLQDQELDTRESTGVIYWEGDVKITGSQHGRPVTGEGYIELTGYAPVQASP